MNDKESNQIESKRETSKIGLNLFVDNLKDNNFSKAVYEQIEKLQKELDDSITDFLNIQQQSDQNECNYYLDTEFLDDKLTALSEMNIVYAFKDLEINIKKLLRAAYGIDVQDFYKWKSILNFLKLKKIKASELNGYQEINDLRELNNHIKHSTSQKINNKIKSIPEFKEHPYLRHYELNDFFNRVKDSPYTFLDALSTEIYKELYEFDSNRLKSLAKLFALHMDKKSAETFIEELKELY